MWLESLPNLSDIIWLNEAGNDGRYDANARLVSPYRCSYAPYFSIQYQQGQPIDDL